jgi:hypothetical protein
VERALVNEAARAGLPVTVDDALDYQFGYSRTAPPDSVDQMWYVVENGGSLSVLAAAPGARVLWNASPLSDRDERALQDGQRELWRQLQRAHRDDLFYQLQSPLVALTVAGIPGVDGSLAARVAALNQRAQRGSPCRCGIVAFDAGHGAAAAGLLPPGG